jgi:hypothetical protein
MNTQIWWRNLLPLRQLVKLRKDNINSNGKKISLDEKGRLMGLAKRKSWTLVLTTLV